MMSVGMCFHRRVELMLKPHLWTHAHGLQSRVSPANGFLAGFVLELLMDCSLGPSLGHSLSDEGKKPLEISAVPQGAPQEA